MKGKIVIIGAGAIGRGFLPWVIDLDIYELIFVDVNHSIVNLLKENKGYSTYCVKEDHLQELKVNSIEAYHSSEFDFSKYSDDVEAVFVNVGPRDCSMAVSGLSGANCPIILCENDPSTVNIVKNALNYDKVYFAIPDVITSNTAPSDLLDKDPLSIVTEDGVLFVDERVGCIKGRINFCTEDELLNKQWIAKLYLHNTPHCIAAYLGALIGVNYLHEAMNIPDIKKIVVGVMDEMLTALKLKWDIPHSFLDFYANKEIKRFSCRFLFDPISRVAREPLRKLELEGRLIGAAQMCISLGAIPNNILLGIVSAILFNNKNDPDNHLVFIRKVLPPQILMTYILGLREGEALEKVMSERFSKIISQLEILSQGNRIGGV